MLTAPTTTLHIHNNSTSIQIQKAGHGGEEQGVGERVMEEGRRGGGKFINLQHCWW